MAKSNCERVTFSADTDTMQNLNLVFQYLQAREGVLFRMTNSAAIRFALQAAAEKIRRLEADKGRAR